MSNIRYPINERLAGIVPMPSAAEQKALTDDIRQNGLLSPIILWRGEIVDGRCRQQACIETNTEIRTESLEWELEEEDVANKVKSLNTRRNLTLTQKGMVAFRIYLNSNGSLKMYDVAAAWGIARQTMANISYIHRQEPQIIEALFNGNSIVITNQHGDEVKSNKINSICQYLKRLEEQRKVRVETKDENNWVEDSVLHTQTAKDWYYSTVDFMKINDITIRQLLVELANYKYPKDSK